MAGKALGIQLIHEPGTIGDFYDFGSVLGQGGFGTVSEIHHAKTFKPFAGKVVDKNIHFTEQGMEVMFRRVIEKLLNVQNPYILKILHAFEDATSYYLVMDVCQGGTLRDLIKSSRGTLPVTVLDDVSQQTVAAIDFLHQLGMLHRDIKPDNLMLANKVKDLPDVAAGRRRVKIKLVDFDMCCFLDQRRDVKESMLQGTPGYMAPEVVGSCRYTVRSDLYAFGCVLYVALIRQDVCNNASMSTLPTLKMMVIINTWLDSTHRLCAEAEKSVAEEAYQTTPSHYGRNSLQVNGQPTDGTFKDIPLRLWRLLAWCLERDPVQRPESAEEILRSGLLRVSEAPPPSPLPPQVVLKDNGIKEGATDQLPRRRSADDCLPAESPSQAHPPRRLLEDRRATTVDINGLLRMSSQTDLRRKSSNTSLETFKQRGLMSRTLTDDLRKPQIGLAAAHKAGEAPAQAKAERKLSIGDLLRLTSGPKKL